MAADKHFFDTIRRPLFGGRLNRKQVDGLNRLVDYAVEHDFSDVDTAYALATAHHETGRRMQPIREGFARTDAGARRAVTNIYDKGIIRTNYSLPDGPYRLSYYGRGLVQITWYDNYVRMGKLLGIPLARNPDLALEWDVALPLLYTGMRKGLYTGKALKDYRLPKQFREARAIINGDVRKNGRMIAGYADYYLKALNA